MTYPTQYGELVLVEYHFDNTVHRAVTRDAKGELHERLFTECLGDGDTYVEEDGYGHDGAFELKLWSDVSDRRPIWYDESIRLRKWVRNTDDGSEHEYVLEPGLAALGMKRISEPFAPDPFTDTRDRDDIDASLDYCCACDGYVRSDQHCNHLTDGDDGLCGPGSDEVGDEVPDGFKRIVRLTGCARALRKMLRAREQPKTFHSVPLIGRDSVSITISGRRFDAAFNNLHNLKDDTGIREGFCWIIGLDAKTDKANKLVLTWIDEEIAGQNARRVSGEKCYRVKVGRYMDDYVTRRVSWTEAVKVAKERRTENPYDGARIVRVKKTARASVEAV